jgi:hypothetical protein
MVFCGLIFIGAALVLLGTRINAQRMDPMGIFGLPSVCAITCRSANLQSPATGRINWDSSRGGRKAA